MQLFSNDTSSWNVVDVPLIPSILYNDNTYGSVPHGSVSMGNVTVEGIESKLVNNEVPGVNYWALLLIVFPLFTIVGNVMVVISVYREKSLHTVTNYFVVSLAISDITVAAVVMPFAIYLEFNRVWELSERLCDFWVASDCMACTASILNLVAIAVDRYIAVTKPLKYARHKSPKRVAIMIVIVWLVSFFIALPIVSGVNKSDVADHPRVPDQCAFFNNKFLIFSSLGSFFIPCIIIFGIYYRIFLVIMRQAKRTRQQWRPKAVIESAAAQHRSNADHLITSYYHERTSIVNPTSIAVEKTSLTSPIDGNEPIPVSQATLEIERNCLMLKLSTPVLTPPTKSSKSNPSQFLDGMDEDEGDDISLVGRNDQETNGIKSIEHKSSNSHSKSVNHVNTKHGETPCHYPATRMKTRLKTHFSIEEKPSTAGTGATSSLPTSNSTNTKLAKRKAYSRMKKERKATQTLIIVLICFLVCWLPFFVLNNIVNAIVRLTAMSRTWLITDFTLFLCVWLGYINSFLNPIIYTIFNLEFRKAFVKILFTFCRLSRHSSRSS